MKLQIIFFTLTLASCGANKVEPIYGKTTTLELNKMMGAPVKEETIPVKSSKVFHYANGDKYQIKENVVSNGFLIPQKDEKALIYWKHAFKDCETTTEVLTKKKQGHEASELLMKCDSLGVGVVYREHANFITKIIKYEKI